MAVLLPILAGAGWWYFREQSLADYGPAFREYAYVSNGKSNTVSVIDLRTFELTKTLRVGIEPTGLAINSKKNEIYVVNTGSSNVGVIDAESNTVVATIGVYGRPYAIDVSQDGKRAYVANSASANVSVIDLDKRVVIAHLRVGSSPGLARVTPDGSTVVVSNRGDNTVSLIDAKALQVRATLPVCQQPEDIAIVPDSSKAFVSCSGSSQVASIQLQSPAHNQDRVLALLDVGRTPVALTMKPDGGEMMVCNFDSNSISIVETGNDEVGSSPEIGQHPARAVVTSDSSRLYVSNFGSNSVAVYDIDMGRRLTTLPVGSRPESLALTPDQNYLLVADTESGDVTIIQKRTAPPHARNVGVFPADPDPRGRAAQCDRHQSIYGAHAKTLAGISLPVQDRDVASTEAIESSFQLGGNGRSFARFDVAALHKVHQLPVAEERNRGRGRRISREVAPRTFGRFFLLARENGVGSVRLGSILQRHPDRGTHAAGSASANRIHHDQRRPGILERLIDRICRLQFFHSQASQFLAHGNAHHFGIHRHAVESSRVGMTPL